MGRISQQFSFPTELINGFMVAMMIMFLLLSPFVFVWFVKWLNK